MDLNSNQSDQTPIEESDNVDNNSPVSVRNLKRKAHYASTFLPAKFPAEYQPLPLFTQALLHSTTGN